MWKNWSASVFAVFNYLFPNGVKLRKVVDCWESDWKPNHWRKVLCWWELYWFLQIVVAVTDELHVRDLKAKNKSCARSNKNRGFGERCEALWLKNEDDWCAVCKWNVPEQLMKQLRHSCRTCFSLWARFHTLNIPILRVDSLLIEFKSGSVRGFYVKISFKKQISFCSIQNARFFEEIFVSIVFLELK